MDNVTVVINSTETPSTQEHFALLPGDNTWIALLYYLMIFTVGTPGNGLIIRVYTQRKYKSSTHILILGLAIVDITVCFLRPVMLYYRYYDSKRYTQAQHILGSFDFIAVGVSAFLTSVIAFDRYDAACNPHKRVMTRHRARYAIVIGIVFSLAFNSVSIAQRFMKVNTYISLTRHVLVIVLYIFTVVSTSFFYSRVYEVVTRQTSSKRRVQYVFDPPQAEILQHGVPPKKNGKDRNQVLPRQNGQSNLIQREVPSDDPPTNHLRVNLSYKQFQLLSRTSSNETLATSPSPTPSPSPIPVKKPTPEKADTPSPDASNPVILLSEISIPEASDMPCLDRRGSVHEVEESLKNPAKHIGTCSNQSSEKETSHQNTQLATCDQHNTSEGTQASPTGSPEGIPTATPNNATSNKQPVTIKYSAGNARDKRFHSKVTRMLLLAALVFFLTWLPFVLLTLTGMLMKWTNYKSFSVIFKKSITAFETLYINNMANPWIYSIANEKFRQECKKIIRELFLNCRLSKRCCQKGNGL